MKTEEDILAMLDELDELPNQDDPEWFALRAGMTIALTWAIREGTLSPIHFFK